MLGEKESNKYLLEMDTIKQIEMKGRGECLRRTRKLQESKRCSMNLIKEINIRAVLLVRYSVSFLNWTREEIRFMNHRTRRLMTKYKVSNTDYIKARIDKTRENVGGVERRNNEPHDKLIKKMTHKSKNNWLEKVSHWELCKRLKFYHIDKWCIHKPEYDLKNHHHHVVPLARISLTLSRHFSLSFIAFGRSSGLHPVSSHTC